MRILFCTTAGSGHFEPLLAVLRACAAAGHQVAVAAPASFAAEVARASVEHRPFADVSRSAMGAVFARLPEMSMVDANRTVLTEVFGRLDAQAALPGLLATIADWRPALLVREPSELASLAAGAVHGVPQAQIAIGLSDMDRWAFDLLPEPLAELDRVAGLPVGRSLELLRETPVLTSVPQLLDRRPAAGATEAEGVGGGAPVHRYRDLPPTAAPDLPPAWGRAEDPLVYATYGSVAGGLAPMADVYRGTLQALAGLPVRVLLTTGRGLDPESLRPWPANVWVERWWPQAAVLPLAALVLGHGGFGTTMAALASGVPQVVLPLFAADQFLNADRVQDVGAGLVVTGGPTGTAGLPAAVRRVLAEPDFRHRAAAVAAAMAALPDVATCVPVLEDLAQS
ncbi:MAG: putative glycosyltransferase [Friedmanniella sp.]|nr:putative glycosyltransferase [Friedmanniella sp.]